MKSVEINKDIYIEELVNHYTFSIRYLAQKGIRCIACGEPVWGTLEEAAREKGFEDSEIQNIVDELRDLSSQQN
jgi:methionine synthase II (cobalamin-independent)